MTESPFLVGFLGGCLVAATITMIKSVYRIEEGHLGVLLTFGKADFLDEEKGLLKMNPPGLHFKWPWQTVVTVTMMEQSLDLSGKDGGISAMASDGTILRLDSRLRYAPVREELYDYLFALRKPVEHIKGLFTCLLRNEIANFKVTEPALGIAQTDTNTGSYSVIRRERKLLNHRLEGFARDKMGGRYGVRFDGVDLTDILPPDELADALNAVFNAQTEADTRYARAEGEAQSRILAAEKGVLIAADRARAAEIEIRTLGKYLAELKAGGTLKEYVERRKAEATFESRAVFLRRAT